VQVVDSAVITNTLLGLKSIFLFGKEILVDPVAIGANITAHGLNDILLFGKHVIDPVVIGQAMSHKVVVSLFGLTSYINPIVNMPAVLSMALAMSLVPAISSSRAEGDELSVSNKSGVGIKLSMLVGLPCGLGLFMLSTTIIRLLYTVRDPMSLGLLPEAGNLLAIMGVGVFFLTILQTMTGILQGLGKTYIPVVNLFIGIAVKIAISLVFIRIPEINIAGAYIGTAACYGVAALLDVVFVIKHARARLRFMDNLLKPLISAAAMGAVVFLVMPKIPLTDYSRPLTIALVALAIFVYVLFIFFTGALTKEDMEYIPGGGRVTSLMYKLRLWKRQ
jgi:stage V sporulation protein B